MTKVNDVTLATLNTTDISTDNVKIQGEDLSSYIFRHSTGSKIQVESKISSGTLIAKISCDSKIVDVYSPLSVTKDEDYVEINESIGIDGKWIWLKKPVQSIEFSLSAGYINTKEVRGDVIKAQNIGPYDLKTLEQKESTISSDGRSICKELITRSAGSIVSKETYVYDLPEKNGTLAIDENCTALEVFATSADIEPGTKSDTLAPTTWTLWNATTEYKEGVIVKKDENTVYVCISKSTNIEPGISENWQNYWKKIETEFLSWSSSTEYLNIKFDFVKGSDGKTYYPLNSNINCEPGNNEGWITIWNDVVPTDWDASKNYVTGNVVKVTSGNTYYAIKNNINIQPELATDWDKSWQLVVEWNETSIYTIKTAAKIGSRHIVALQKNKNCKPENNYWINVWQEKELEYISPIKDGYLTYAYGVPACMTEELIIATDSSKDASKVTIDWGDNKKEEMMLKGETTISHTYTEPGKYIVKLYGPIYRIKWSSTKLDIVSRIFEQDLPVSKYLWAVKSNDWQKTRNFTMLSMMKPTTLNFSQIPSFYGFLAGHFNLRSYIDNSHLIYIGNSHGFYANCKNLLEISVDRLEKNGYYVSYEGTYAMHFQNCISLVSNIARLLPFRGNFAGCRCIMVNNLFNNCKNLTFTPSGTDADIGGSLTLSNIFWKDTSKVWANQNTVFATAGSNLRAIVPTSWGGTAS